MLHNSKANGLNEQSMYGNFIINKIKIKSKKQKKDILENCLVRREFYNPDVITKKL